MKLSAPTQLIWIIAVVLGVLGIIASLVAIPVVSGFAFWILALGWLLLVIATVMKGV